MLVGPIELGLFGLRVILFFFLQPNFNKQKKKMHKAPTVVVPQLSLKNYIHPIATVLIAWAIAANGFPQPPQLFKDIVQN